MNGVLRITFIVILSVEFIIGTFGNGFIAVVNIMDLVKGRNFSSVDQILTALAISRIALLWLVLVCSWLYMLYPGKWMTKRIVGIIYSIWTTFNQSSLWFATSLSIFCFFRIANFSNPIFLYLKVRVKKVMTGTLIMSLVLLCLNIVVINASVNILITDYDVTMSNSLILNNTQFSMLFLFANIMFGFIPFAVLLLTFLFLVFPCGNFRGRCDTVFKDAEMPIPRPTSEPCRHWLPPSYCTPFSFCLLCAKFGVLCFWREHCWFWSHRLQKQLFPQCTLGS